MKNYSVHSCPVGPSLGHDGDECRVNSYQDGTAFCSTCNTLYPAIAGRSQVRATLSALARVASNHGYRKPPFIEGDHHYPNTISCCQQLDHAGRSFAVLTIDQSHFNLPEHNNSPKPLQQQFITDPAPESVVSAIQALEELGFSLHHRTDTQFLMRLGDADGGLNITVSYL